MATTSADPADSGPSARFVLGWQLAALLLLLALPVVILGETPWSLPRNEKLSFLALLAAFAASAGIQWLILRLPADRNRLFLMIVTTAAVFCGVFLFFLVTQRIASRKLLLAFFLITLVLLPLPMLKRRYRRVSFAAAAMVLLFVSGLAVSHAMRDKQRVSAKTTETYINTTFYNLRVRSHAGKVPYTLVRGGGLARVDAAGNGAPGQSTRVLLARGDGRLYLIDSAPGALKAQLLKVRVPLNGEAFSAEFGTQYGEPDPSSSPTEVPQSGVQTWRFRVADVLVQSLPDDRIRILASHHYWLTSEKCFVLRVSALELPVAELARANEGAAWHTAFETTPCLPLSGENSKRARNKFQGEEIGGRLAVLDDHTVLVSVGDMGFTGLDTNVMLAQDPEAHYGKIVRVDLRTGSKEIFTLGHRNPQGLYITPDGAIWSTEHGARGGDELNAVHAGANYGWPRVTYGVDYSAYSWPHSQHQGHHDRYVEPVYAWLPSIGVSNLTAITRPTTFPVWQGDLLVGSLIAKSLYRIGIRGERAVFIEPILLNERVRDILELDDGRLLLWTDAAKLLEIAPATGMTAEVLYGAQCSGCHVMVDGTWHRLGPDLQGVMGRGIAGAQGFTYSPALKRIQGDWTAEKLDAFLADPQAFAPGTSMAFAGVKSAQERQLLVEHLVKGRSDSSASAGD